MRLITACAVFLLLFATACDRAPRTTSAAAEYDISQDRDAYEDRAEARLNEFEYRLDGLEARMKGLDGRDRDNLRVDIDELRARKEALEQKLGDLNKVSDQSWQD